MVALLINVDPHGSVQDTHSRILQSLSTANGARLVLNAHPLFFERGTSNRAAVKIGLSRAQRRAPFPIGCRIGRSAAGGQLVGTPPSKKSVCFRAIDIGHEVDASGMGSEGECAGGFSLLRPTLFVAWIAGAQRPGFRPNATPRSRRARSRHRSS